MKRLEQKYQILLQMEVFRTMTTELLGGDYQSNENAIKELRAEGLVTTKMGEFGQEGKILSFSITTRGEKKRKQLLEECR